MRSGDLPMPASRWATNPSFSRESTTAEMCIRDSYYLYQCDLIKGSAHLRTPIRTGLEIIEGLRGHTTGYAIPQLVIDAPGGGGKIPINPNYVVSSDERQTLLRNYEGKEFLYPEAQELERLML